MNVQKLSQKEITDLLQGKDDKWLFEEASKIKGNIFGKDVYIRGVVEFSNFCKEDCFYCGLRRSNGCLVRYRLAPLDIMRCAEVADSLKIKTLVLQSGEDYFYSKEQIAGLIQRVKSRYDIAVTLSIGERRNDELKFSFDVGAERYLLKVETFDEKLYEQLRPGKRLSDRIGKVMYLKELGYETGSGIIVGLPGQTVDSISRDIIKLSELNLEMIACGPFIPHPETPLGGYPPGDPLTTIRVVAILRILNPSANIPSTSALSSFGEEWRRAGLKAGANVVMPSLTPEKVKDLYSIYPGKNSGYDEIFDAVEGIKRLIREAGFIPSESKGYSKRRLDEKCS